MDMGSFMQQFVQQLINGISLGSIYALVALGSMVSSSLSTSLMAIFTCWVRISAL